MKQHPVRRAECFAFLVSMIGVQLSSELYAQWGAYFYSPTGGTSRIVYVSIGLTMFIFMAGRLFDIFTDPLIGAWSDRASQKPGRWRIVRITGRRRPFIFWGAVLMTVTGIAFWYPPVAGESKLNFVYATVMMSLHWGLYTLAYIPLLALAPEIARSETERVRLGTWIAVGMILGLIAAVLLPGILIELLDPARHLVDGEMQFSPVGYQRVAILFALVSLGCFLYFVWVVKERPVPAEEAQSAAVYTQFRMAFQEPVFRRYLLIFFLFYIGLLANQRALPYWAELGLEGDEGTVTLLGIPFIVLCLGGALACPLLCKRFRLKTLVIVALATVAFGLPFMYLIATSAASVGLKTSCAAAVYGLNGIGLGMMYVLVTPLIGQIIDHSAARTGHRQEAVFNALHAVMVKTAQVLAIALAMSSMSAFGNTADRPLGVYLVAPLASLFCIAALGVATTYPRLGGIPLKKC